MPGNIAAARFNEGAASPLRISHWQANDDNPDIRCTYDSAPGSPNTPAVLLIPGNAQAPIEAARESPLIPWLRRKHGQGVVLAAVCGGVFILARTGLLAGPAGHDRTGHSAINSPPSSPDVPHRNGSHGDRLR